MNKQRLDKTICSQGMLSRKEAKELIRRGQVTVNGRVEKQADAAVDWDQDIVALSGAPLSLQQHVYLMLNKPTGVVSATEDAAQTTVVDLVPPQLRRKGLFPAGRLDKDTTGLVILTDDGEFAHNILSPKKHVQKEYLAQVDGKITLEIIEAFRAGVNVNNEYTTLPSRLTVEQSLPQGDIGRVVLREGMYHQIKRMFRSFGLTVTQLHRVSIGNLLLDEALLPGQCRPLTPQELEMVQQREEISFSQGAVSPCEGHFTL